MRFKKNIFISHSSNNKNIAEQLCAYLTRLGIGDDRIFCSSILGQGVSNGEKLNEAIGKAIKKSGLIIFLISRDFMKSNYCLEELGIGWYLSQHTNTSCFYLILPDIKSSELNGFVNSKIDKFTFVDSNCKDQFCTFIVDVISTLHLKNPKHQTIMNANNIFFSSIKQYLNELIINQDNAKKEEQIQYNEIENLKKIINKQEQIIKSTYNNIVDKENQIKYDTLISLFHILGITDGLNKKQIETLSKGFWFNMLNNYIELEKSFGSKNASMQILLANLYSYQGCLDEAYQRLLKYIELNDSNIYPNYFDNVVFEKNNTADEAIELLKKKLETVPLGVVYDSYKKTIAFLENRKNNMLSK